VLALVFGILSILVCSVLGPFAWIYGKRAEEAVDASGGAYGGRDMATIGKILGMIGTALLVLSVLVGIVAVIVLIAGAASSSN
jgi:uncharacterized membrane protein YjgN (DUF898 family)